MELYKFDLSTFDCVSNGVGTRWIKWKRAFEIYANARKISDQKQKCSMLLHCGGMQLQDIYFTLKGDLSKYDDAEKALTQYFQLSINVPFERHVFRNASQRDDETIEQFITRLRQKAETCEFTKVEEHIRDQIIEKCNSNVLRQKFLEKRKRVKSGNAKRDSTVVRNRSSSNRKFAKPEEVKQEERENANCLLKN